MTPLTRQDALAHQSIVPWPLQSQVEQDLLLCRAMVALFNDPFLSNQIAMRGGTVLHKDHLAPASRYSEDIDLVAIGDRPEEHIRAAIKRGKLRFSGSTTASQTTAAFAAFLAQLRQVNWVVHAKRPFAGPRQVLAYLGRYTHRVAIGNQRLVSLSDAAVRFRWRDYAHDNATKVMTLTPAEFIRRFLLHVLPTGFMRIRHYGWLANRSKRERISRLRLLLDQPEPPKPEPESVAAFLLRVCHLDITRCPQCGAQGLRVQTLYPRSRSPP